MENDQSGLIAPDFMTLLTPETRALLRHRGSCVSYEDSQLLHSRGANKPGLSVVETGLVLVSITDADGKQIVTGMLGPGHCFGEFTLFTQLNRTHDITAIGKTSVLQLSESRFMQCYRELPDIPKALMTSTLYRLHILLESMDALRRLPVEQKVAKMLVIMSYSSGQPKTVPLCHEELANTLGMSRVSVGKALKSLAQRGLIQLGYRQIVLPDRIQLQHWLQASAQETDILSHRHA